MKKLKLTGIVYDSMERQVMSFLETVNSGDEFVVYINSPGGSVFAGLSIYNQLKEYNPWVKVVGQASSIAAIIACAAGKNRLWIAESAMMLIHKPWLFTFGNEDDLIKIAKELKNIKESVNTALVRKTGKTQLEIEKQLVKEEYMKADQCFNYGLADKVYVPGDDEIEDMSIITDPEENYTFSRQVRAAMASVMTRVDEEYLAKIAKEQTYRDDIPTQKQINEYVHNRIQPFTENEINDNLNNNGGDMLTNEQKLAKYDVMEANFDRVTDENAELTLENKKLKAQIEKSEQKVSGLEETFAKQKKVHEEAFAKQKKQHEEAIGTLQKEVDSFNAKKTEIEIDAFLAKNANKIKPAEKDELREELIAFKGINQTINGKTLYDRKVAEIEARKPFNDGFNVDVSGFNNTTDDDPVLAILEEGK